MSIINCMNLSPKNLPFGNKSPSFKQGIDKIKFVNNTNYPENEVKIQNYSKHECQQMQASCSSLQNTKAFFQSQINLLMRMLQQTNTLYHQKEIENAELSKKLANYEQKWMKPARQTVQKIKGIDQKKDIKDNKKTQRKPDDQEYKLGKLSKDPSEFIQSNQQELKIQELIKDIKSVRKTNQNQYYKSKKENLQQTLNEKNQEIEELRNKCLRLQSQKATATSQKIHISFERENLQRQHSMLKFKYDNLERRYRTSEDSYGKMVIKYQIQITNLKELIAGIKNFNLPRKTSKLEQGYCSFNQIIDNNESMLSFASSSNASYYKQKQNQAEIHLKEENQYLRTQLIKILDQKGVFQLKLNKYKKILKKYQKLPKQLLKEEINISTENDINKSNKIQTKNVGKSQLKSFKKSDHTSILVVEDTEKKQKQYQEQNKQLYLLKELGILLNINLLPKIQLKSSSNNLIKNQLLQIIILKIKEIINQNKLLHSQLQKTLKQIQILNKQKFLLKTNNQFDINQFKTFLLKEITENNSEDSTDQKFKNVQLKITEKNIKSTQNQIKFILLAQLKKKEIQYLQKIKDQENLILKLQDKVSSLEEMTASFYHLTSKSQSQPNLQTEMPKSTEVVPYSNSKFQTREGHILELSSFQLFKHKLTEFYQHTIKQLEEWSISALKNQRSSSKKLIQLSNDSENCITYSNIPNIIQKNISRVSQQFKSLKNNSFYCESINQNQQNNQNINQQINEIIPKNQAVASQQFDSLQFLISKRLLNFQQFSTKWIQKAIERGNSSIEISQKIPNFNLKQKEQLPSIVCLNNLQIDSQFKRQSNKFERELEEIDAFSEVISNQNLMEEIIQAKEVTSDDFQSSLELGNELNHFTLAQSYDRLQKKHLKSVTKYFDQ